MRQVPEPHIKNCIFLSGNMLWQMCSLGNSRFTSAVVQMFLYAADPEEQSCACCSVLAGLHRNLGCEAPRAVVAKPGPASEMVLAVMGVQGAVCGLCHTWTSKASPREWLPRAIPVCWKADRSVGASQHLHSSFPGTAAQLGTSVYLCSFKSLGLTLLFYCWSGVVFNTDFFKSHASIWIFSWEDQMLAAFWWFQSKTRGQLCKGAKWQGDQCQGQTVSLYRRCFAGSALFHVSLLAAFLLLSNTVSSSQSSSVRLLWVPNIMPVISKVCLCRRGDLQK